MTVRNFYSDIYVEGNINILSGKTYQINNIPIISNLPYNRYSWTGTTTAASQNAVNDAIFLKRNVETGFVSGLTLSINVDNTKFNISAGYYVVTDFSDFLNPIPTMFYYAGAVGVTPTYLSGSNATYVALDHFGVIVQSSIPFTATDRRYYAILGAVVHSNRININVTNELKAPLGCVTNQLHDFMKVIGTINSNGNVYSANGANLNINKSGGEIFGLGLNAHNSTDPHTLMLSGQTAVTFRYRLRDGTEYTDTTNINPTQYDNAGVLTTVDNNKFTIQHINLFPSNISRLQYGQNQYASMSDAIVNLSTEPFVVEQNIADNAIFRCYLIIQKGVTDLAAGVIANTVKFVSVDKFGNVIGSAGVSMTYQDIIDALGYTPEDVANKVTTITSGSTDTQYPSAKLLYDQLQIVKPMTVAGDIIYGGVNGLPTRLGIGGANTVLHGGASSPSWSGVVEADMVLSNNATNNATVLRHGFMPILSGVATQYLDGNGNFSTPAGGGSTGNTLNSFKQTSFTSLLTVNVVHNFGTFPVVQVVDNVGAVIIPLSIVNNTINDFTVSFTSATTGKIMATVGSPPISVIVVNNDYTIIQTDRIIKVNTSGKIVTLITAVNNLGREYIIHNATNGNTTVKCFGSEKINNQISQLLPPFSSMTVYSDGVGWNII